MRSKNQLTLLALISLVSIGSLVGCGAEHPFQRGEGSDSALDGDASATAGDSESATAKDLYIKNVYPNLKADCMSCHDGSNGAFDMAGNPESDYTATKAKITPGKPEESQLVQMVVGQGGHGGGTVWSMDSAEVTALKNWIKKEK
jgi:hypothetical protein